MLYFDTILQCFRHYLIQFLGHIMRKEGLGNLVLKGHIFKTERGRRKQLIAYLTSLCRNGQQNGVGRILKKQPLLRATKHRKLWRAMIIHLLKRDGLYKIVRICHFEKECIFRLLKWMNSNLLHGHLSSSITEIGVNICCTYS